MFIGAGEGTTVSYSVSMVVSNPILQQSDILSDEHAYAIIIRHACVVSGRFLEHEVEYSRWRRHVREWGLSGMLSTSGIHRSSWELFPSYSCSRLCASATLTLLASHWFSDPPSDSIYLSAFAADRLSTCIQEYPGTCMSLSIFAVAGPPDHLRSTATYAVASYSREQYASTPAKTFQVAASSSPFASCKLTDANPRPAGKTRNSAYMPVVVH